MTLSDRLRLDGRVAFVTGASSGLGAHFASTLVAAGAPVAIAARRADRLEALAKSIRELGGTVHAVELDVTDPASVEAAVAAAEAALGPIQILINNAGVGEPASFLDTSEESFQRIINVNLTGVFICMKYELAQFMQQGGGVIVNMSSLAGLKGAPGLSAYVASKHGVLGLTRVAAQEFARRNVRVNALCPYYIDTPLIKDVPEEQRNQMVSASPMKRLGRAEEVAKAFIYLASDDSSYTNGTQLVIDSGVIS